MSSADPNLGKLYSEIPIPHEGVSSATALIAATPPSQLEAAINDVLIDDIKSRVASSDEVAAEAALRATQPVAEGEKISSIDFANEVSSVRDRLGRPIRWGAAILCAAVLGASGAGLAVKGSVDSNARYAAKIAKDWSKDQKGQKPQASDSELSAQQIESAAEIGLAGLAVGGFTTFMVGDGLTRRGARWRARREIRKAEKSA